MTNTFAPAPGSFNPKKIGFPKNRRLPLLEPVLSVGGQHFIYYEVDLR